MHQEGHVPRAGDAPGPSRKGQPSDIGVPLPLLVHFDTRLRGHRDDRSAIGMQQCREGLARQMTIGQESNASSWIQDTNAAGGL
jgi:hypothetical protein